MEGVGVPGNSDDALMKRAQENDASAFAHLYDRHAASAFTVAQAVCHNSSLAEEAVQEGFLSIWRGRSGYRSQVGSTFRGWAMESVRNRAIDSVRNLTAAKRPQMVAIPVAGLPEAASNSPLEDMIDDGERDSLHDHLKQLPEAQAEVITLAFFGQMTHEAISEHLDLPAGTVKGRMRLGLEKLRRDIGPDPN